MLKIEKEVRSCQENVKSAEKVRYQETAFLTQIDILEESGMLIFRQLELKKTEQLEKLMFVLSASDLTRLTVPSNI